MKVNEIPIEEIKFHPERVTIALSTDAFQKLKAVKRIKNKKPSVLIRELIEEFFEKNKDFFESEEFFKAEQVEKIFLDAA